MTAHRGPRHRRNEDAEIPPVEFVLLQPVEIELTRAEGPTRGASVNVGETKIARSYDEANRIIRRIAETAPDGGGYDKTDFLITFEDGATYEGRYDVVRADLHGREMLQRHVRETQGFFAGEYRPEWTRRDRESDANYQQAMRMYEADGSAQRARDFLNAYDVGQEG